MARRLGREDGAAAVEFALIVGVLSMLIFGMLEYGLFFLQDQSLKAAAREGARVAAVGGTYTDIKSAVVKGSGSSLQPGYACLYVDVLPTGSPVPTHTDCNGPQPSGQQYCYQAAPTATLGQEVVVTLPTGSGSNYNMVPSDVGQAFQIDIPFLPHLNVHPTINGSFRCEQ